MKRQSAEVAVVGGGAAGMMAAATAAELGADVVLLERGSYTGKKLRITGKGRCNVTNHCSPREIQENVPTNGKFLFSVLDAFSPTDVMALFENLGVPMKTERGRRVFPVSDAAADVVEALRRYCRKTGVETIFARVTGLEKRENEEFLVKTEAGELTAKKVIVCTGGISYPLTGSTGDGYEFARRFGHTIVEPKASLVPLETEGELCPSLQGLSLKNVTFTVTNPKKKVLFSEQGEMMFTHFGITGPLVLSASAHIRNWDRGPYIGHIDLKPALDEKTLDARIQRDLKENANRDVLNAIRGLMPAKLVPVAAALAGIPETLKANSVTKGQRLALLNVLKDLHFTLSGTRPVDEAVITSGGVSIREVNPATMESKLCPGLYFAGEILDVDAYTGGYNLQIAWSTARAAGLRAGERT